MRSDDPRLGVIGGSGWLGRAILTAVLRSRLVAPETVTASNRSGASDALPEWPDIHWTSDNAALAERSDVIVLSVRPDQAPAVAIDASGKTIVSVMAAVSTGRLRRMAGTDRIVRAMPNAAAEIGKSYTPWFATPEVPADDRVFVRRLFEACGTTDEVFLETHIDYFTGLTGSGPAFPALLGQAMLGHALARGLPEGIAARAVRALLVDAVQLLARPEASFEDVVGSFLSYEGTTAAGLRAMTDAGLPQAVHAGLAATEAAVRRMACDEDGASWPQKTE